MELQDFLNVEEKYGLIQDQIDGFAYWTYFRHDLAVDIMNQMESGGADKEKSVACSKMRKIMARLDTVKYALLFGWLPKGKHDILTLNAERRVWINDHYECIYTDRIVSEYPGSVVLERPYLQSHLRPVNTKNLVYTDFIEIKAMSYWYFHQIFRKKQMVDLRRRIYDRIHGPIEEICKAYQVKYSMNSILDKMVCGYYIYKIKKREFGRILDKVNPKVILEVAGYNIDCMVVNELTSIRDIPTIELQHGATGKAHISYNYPPGIKVKQFPQFLFTFSGFWTDAAAYPLERSNLKEIGFPHFEENARRAKESIKKAFPRQIIFISQEIIGERLTEVAVGLNQLIDKEQYQIVYKLHPKEYREWREKYPRLADSGIQVIDNSHIGLYDLFAASVCQIGGGSSTALFEGLEFGLKTYIMRGGVHPAVAFLCEKNLAKYFDSSVDLYQLILDDPMQADIDINFWKENALENMKREIDIIMNDGNR